MSKVQSVRTRMANPRPFTLPIAAVSVTALLLAACGGSDGDNETTDESDQEQAEAADAEDTENDDGGSEGDYELPAELNFMTGSAGGTWQAIGAALATVFEEEFPDLRVNILPGGSASNLLGVENGEANIALSNAFTTIDGFAGREPFEQELTKVEHLLALQMQTFHMMVPVDSDVQGIEDLSGHSLATLAIGSAGEQGVSDILDAYGMSYDDLSRVEHGGGADLADFMSNGQVDVIANVAPMPASYYIDVTSNQEMRLLNVDEDALATLQESNSGYVPGVIPAGTYEGIDEETQTFSTSAHIVVSNELDDGFVRELVRVFTENVEVIQGVGAAFEEITPESMAADVGLPMSPVAEEYFMEQGLR